MIGGRDGHRDRGHATSSSSAASARVLHGLTCAIPRGSVTGLLGPSGSGKTTLMRADRRRADRRSPARSPCSASRPASPALRARIGYLTQAPSVYADLTVRENARYFASLYGAGRGRRRRRRSRDVGLGRRRRPAGRQPVRRPAQPRLAGLRAGRQARACWCSTSRPSARTRCCATSCGRGSARWPPTAPRCWSPAT